MEEDHESTDGLSNEEASPRSIDERVQVGEEIGAVVKRDGELRAVRMAGMSGNALSADLNDDGSVDYRVQGSSRHGEEGAYEAAQRLATHLNSKGAEWEPVKDCSNSGKADDADIDCKAKSKDGTKQLRIQVIRAITDSEFWSKLSSEKKAEGTLTLEEAVEVLREVIDKKAARTALAQRTRQVLLIDCREATTLVMTPGIAMGNYYGEWLRGLAYQGVWLVGIAPGMTLRLAGPRVTFLFGLCGSGKTHLAQETRRGTGAAFFDGPLGDEAVMVGLRDQLRVGHDCIVEEVTLCTESGRAAMRAALSEFPCLGEEWICFENDRESADWNVTHRGYKDVAEHHRHNLRMELEYTIPPEATVLPITRCPPSPAAPE